MMCEQTDKGKNFEQMLVLLHDILKISLDGLQGLANAKTKEKKENVKKQTLDKLKEFMSRINALEKE